MCVLVNRHILLWVKQERSARSKLSFRWPWSSSPQSVFQAITSQMYFHNDRWVGIATQKVDNTLVAECLLHQGYFFKEAKENTRCPDLQVKSLPQPGGGLSLHIGCYKVHDKRNVDLLFSRACKPNDYQERNERALSSKCSGNQWLSQWQEGRTTARGVFA